jgi:uncharacterized protein YdeI (YjbR/CyaY-like superfamily)
MARHRFQAVLERSGNSLGWTIVRVPEKVTKALATRGQARVKGTVNGFEFRTSLFPDGEGRHVLLVNKTMQKGAGVLPGGTARLELEADTEERTVEVPAELMKALRQDKTVLRYYGGLSPSLRRDLARWVAEAKGADTRLRRAEDIAERLMLVREGEREPPPVLRAEFARDPRARMGWELMPPSHKRFHLFGIFGYKSQESKTRRMAKAVEMMVEYAEKKRRKS